ncbi:MAG: hypothetical protein Q9218_008085, partial [Villophora microphyllina]
MGKIKVVKTLERHWSNPTFIRFNGSLSAHYTPPPALSSQCHEFDIDVERAATVYVGVYPLWDPNSFFFHIAHDHSEACASVDCPENYYHTNSTSSSLDNEKRQFLFQTRDQLYQLDFASTYYVCQKDSHECGTVEVNPYFVGAQPLDLSKASTERMQIGNETGYRVQGDEKTWVSNGTSEPSFHFGEAHTLYSNAPATTCLKQPDKFVWNVTTPFNYTLSFSNTSASATLILVSPRGTVRMQINGTRVDDYHHFQRYAYKQNINPTIALDISDPEGPGFVWSNGTKIERLGKNGRPVPSTTTAGVPRATTKSSQASSHYWSVKR